ncbi:VOC family protein [uncultured Chitinophaga sp.]|uniref:VOC family protein n=1 Tax=uncultured Chitinophaga sp. TaxID=339340 RepID=UPI0025D52285|nr:VOC family protein [uncultured Chitinophaga sp.]
MIAAYPYLNFDGTCEEAFGFYKSVFGGEYEMLMRMGDMPGPHLAPGEENLIMHMALPIGSSMLMGSDRPKSFGPGKDGNLFYVAIIGDDEVSAGEQFKALSAGGKVNMPFEKAPWGDFYGDFTDKFGVQWMFNVGQPR